MMNWRLFRFAALLFTLILAACLATGVSAAPAAPTQLTLTQPDGTTFPARQWGDEWLNGFETDEGYTILRESDGWWAYATLDAGGALAPALQSSGQAGRLLVGSDSPEGLPLHLRPAGGATEAQTTGAAYSPNAGSQPTLVLLASFSNQNGFYTPASFNTLFFGPSNSVQDYFRDASFNQLTLVPAAESHGSANDGIVGWLALNYAHPNTGGNIGYSNAKIVSDALQKADPYINYASYDSNDDGYITLNELHIVVIVAGYEAAYDPYSYPNIWAHRWSLSLSENGITPPMLDGKVLCDTDHNGGYAQFGEIHGDSVIHDDHQATIGVMIHELGHDLTWPDLYDTDYSSEGVGDWSIMGGGSWNSTYSGQAGSSPAMPDAWLKWYQDWITPTVVNGTLSGAAIEQAETNQRAYLLRSNPNEVDWNFNQASGTGEYFLVENRQLTGYDAGLPGCGLLVWHIDESVTSTNLANTNEYHPLVKLIEADGLNDLVLANDRGDAGDPFPGSSNKTTFDNTSTPNSRLYSGENSLVGVRNISACASTMTADLTFSNSKWIISLFIRVLKVVANNQELVWGGLTPLPITLTAENPNNAPLTFSIVSSPTHGTLSGTPPNLTYTPVLNYIGSDSFTFKVNDGHRDSNVATVSITITAPVANLIQNSGFEAGRDGNWIEYSAKGWQLIVTTGGLPGGITPHGGSWAVWLGGDDYETARLSQSFLLSGARYLHFWYWIASAEDTCNKDFARVFVNGALLLTQNLCATNDTNGWMPVTLDLNSFAGSTVLLEFEVTTDVAVNSNYFLDDVSLSSSEASSEPYVPIYEKVDATQRKEDIP